MIEETNGPSANRDAIRIALDEIMPCLRPFGCSPFRFEKRARWIVIDQVKYYIEHRSDFTALARANDFLTLCSVNSINRHSFFRYCSIGEAWRRNPRDMSQGTSSLATRCGA